MTLSVLRATRGELRPRQWPPMRGLANALLALPILCGALLAPEPAGAQQTGYYLRIAPGFAWTTVQHTKEVSIGQGYSTSTSTSSAPELSAHLAGGFRGHPSLHWFLDVEVEGIIYAPRSIEADIQPTTGNTPHEIGPGSWEYTNKSGVGVNVTIERALARPSQRLLFFAGVHRMQTEVASGGPERTGTFEEDRAVRGRWPFTGGAGLAWGPMHLRVSYFRSLIPWDYLYPEFELRYRWRASGVGVNVGVEAF